MPCLNDSWEATLSSLTSYSSDTSVQIYEERLKPKIDALSHNPSSLQQLVNAAEEIITHQFAPDSRSTFTYRKGSEEISVGLDKVMIAMLACAEECGGERGKLYVASAIVACSGEEDVVAALAALVKTNNQPNENSSESATPTAEETASHLSEGIASRKKSFPEDVMTRDGYTCILTGFQDLSHPNPVEGIPQLRLVAAHILGGSIGELDKDHPSSKSFKSAMTTLDILVKFTGLSVQTLEELHDRLNNPSNGLTLEMNAHDAFDHFHWCLKKTEEEHVYDLKIFNGKSILRKPENNRISFKDRRTDFLPPGGSPVDMRPDPHHISIHAALAGIFNRSGVGRFFDELLHRYRDEQGDGPAVRSWLELERLMEEELVRECVWKAFQSVRVR